MDRWQIIWLQTYLEIIKGGEINTKKGNCYHIENQEKVNLSLIKPDEAKKRILSDLKLIYGIGEITEQILKEEGYETIEALIEHPRFGSEAKRFLEIIDRYDTCQIVDWIGHWVSRSHPLILYCSAFHNKEDFGMKIKLLGVKEKLEKNGEAVQFLREKTSGQKVFLKFDRVKYDKKNNLLCYLYLWNKTFLNAHLIKNGLVDVDTGFDYKLKTQVASLEQRKAELRDSLDE